MRAGIAGSVPGCWRRAVHSGRGEERWSWVRSAQAQRRVFAIIGEMRRIVWIAQELRAPASLHGGVFVGKALRLRGRQVAAAADGFVVDQIGERRPQIEIAGR